MNMYIFVFNYSYSSWYTNSVHSGDVSVVITVFVLCVDSPDLLHPGACFSGLWQMYALRLETVLVRDIIDSILFAIGSHPLYGAMDGKRSMIGANILQFSGLLSLNAIAGLITVKQS